MQLRPYQEDAVRGILTYAVANPHGRLLLVVPPRGGKTTIAATAVLLMAHQHGYRALWGAMLSRDRVVLRCRCRDASRCHRGIVARILERLGALSCGELPATAPKQLGFPGV